LVSRRTRRSLRRIRPLLAVVLVTSGLLLIGAIVVAVQAWLAKGDLQEARSSVDAARAAVREGRGSDAQGHLVTGREQASRADSRLWPWLWDTYGHLPVFGSAVRETQGVVRATDVVMSDVLGPLVSAAPSDSQWSGTANLTQLQRLAVPLGDADTKLTAVRAQVGRLPVSRVRALDQGRQELARALDSLAVDVREAAAASAVLPELLGSTRPTRLLVVTQNLAEERATGGLIGAFALVRAEHGRLSLERSGTDVELEDASRPVVDLGKDFDARYGVAESTSTWHSANLTPDVPSAGAILAGLSRRQLDKPVDGVVFVDPVALGYVLRATGPVAVTGVGEMTADNASSLLMKDIYVRYPAMQDQPQRKAALRRALAGVVSRLQQPAPGTLVAQLARAASTGHAQLYAVDDRLESQLRGARLGGALPDAGPYLSVVTQDVGGSKLDYYLEREVTYDAQPSDVAVDVGEGPETAEEGTISIVLRNKAPRSGLPPYVTYRADAPGTRPSGQLKTWLSVYLGPRSAYSSATVDGKPVSLASQVEAGLSVFSTYVTVNPGSSVTVKFTVQQPAAPGSRLLWRQQPRLLPDRLTVRRPQGWVPLYDS
jgi:hypothetical protein